MEGKGGRRKEVTKPSFPDDATQANVGFVVFYSDVVGIKTVLIHCQMRKKMNLFGKF